MISTRISLRIVLAMLIRTAAGQNAPVPEAIPLQLAREAYELYSQIYRHGPRESKRCDFLAPDELLVISREVLATPEDGIVSTLKPRTAEEREMVANLVRIGKVPHVWEEHFNIGRSYRLLAETEESILDDCVFRGFAGHPGDPKCKEFANVRVIRVLSLPSFNKDHTRALVRVVRSCGVLCGGDEFASYMKTASGWSREEPGFGLCALY